MATEPTCETHAWASLGVVSCEGSVRRIWECEQCAVWTAEPFDPVTELPWGETWLAER